MPTIFIVEDDDNIRGLVLYALRDGFAARGFAAPSDFWRELGNAVPDLILLDIMLPEEDGLSILRALKADRKTKHLPVIMLTAKSGEYDRVKGLDFGADDYVTKPFSVLELISRINAVLRRSGSGGPSPTHTIQNVALAPEKHIVTVDGIEAPLTRKEFELLQLLMKNRGIVLTREKILSEVWGMDFDSETRTVDIHIKTLRQKLGAGGGIIQTVRGVGYKAGE
ncbi:MAG: response regulator transcription factor [Firmicutes bacterium]|nr:response regulator transcription factor [Bacillota bacterium]